MGSGITRLDTLFQRSHLCRGQQDPIVSGLCERDDLRNGFFQRLLYGGWKRIP
jgi:hypothetical protein